MDVSTVSAAALDHARRAGIRFAAVRVDQVRKSELLLLDGVVWAVQDRVAAGLSVRVWHEGAWGFAADGDAGNAKDVVDRALEVARHCARIGVRSPEPVGEPAYGDVRWSSEFRRNPFEVAESERVALLTDWSARLLAVRPVEHVRAGVVAVWERKHYADLDGTSASQQRVRVHPQVAVMGAVASLRTQGPPVARGWEYLTGEGWDWDAELGALPEELARKEEALPVAEGCYDLVIAPSNLWLTIHESVGHATELDRALGYETSYAGTTFVRPEDVGSLRYGSDLMTVTADRTTPHALATVGFDDEGVAAQSWDLVRDGVLVGLQTDRRTAAVVGAQRSTGCAFAESALRPVLSRMPNVSLAPRDGGPTTEELISTVDDGIYLAGSDSWSIDSRRHNFQFTAQQAHRIVGGRLAGQLSGVAYQSATPDFWKALSGVGGTGTYQVFGADLCGKGQPVQAAATSHGCPAALFAGIRVVNTGAA